MLMVPRRKYGSSWFDDMFRDSFFQNNESASAMRTDIQEKDGKYLIDIDIPGYGKEDVKAELKDGYLIVTAEKSDHHDEKDEAGNYIRRERHYGQCSRSFFVGEHVKEEDITAAFKDGTLCLEIPKKDAKQIEDSRKFIEIH